LILPFSKAVGNQPVSINTPFFSVLLFIFFLAVYNSNFDYLPGNDARPNLYLPVSLLTEGNLSFEPAEVPFMFTWKMKDQHGERLFDFYSWEEKVGGRPLSD